MKYPDQSKFRNATVPMPRGWHIDPKNDLVIRMKRANGETVARGLKNSLDFWTWIAHYDRESTKHEVYDPKWNDKLPEVARAGIQIRRIDDIEDIDWVDTQWRPGHMTEGTQFTPYNAYA